MPPDGAAAIDQAYPAPLPPEAVKVCVPMGATVAVAGETVSAAALAMRGHAITGSAQASAMANARPTSTHRGREARELLVEHFIVAVGVGLEVDEMIASLDHLDGNEMTPLAPACSNRSPMLVYDDCCEQSGSVDVSWRPVPGVSRFSKGRRT